MFSRSLLLLICLLLISFTPIFAADPTIGWLGSSSGTMEGYTLVAPGTSTTSYLIDNAGRIVHSWPSIYRPGNATYLIEEGGLLRSGKVLSPPAEMNSGGWGGLFQVIDWDGNVLWEFEYSDDLVQQHHDVEMLPNGNVLMLAWEKKSSAEAFAAGRNPALLNTDQIWPEHIIEVSQTGPTSGQIVWEWHLWDHLIQDFSPTSDNFGVVEDHPELLNINTVSGLGSDWIHGNSIDYNPELDQIVISARALDEIWIIDHSTTSAEAAGHSGGVQGRGGDFLYRWGNPQNFGAGNPGDQQLFGQHCVEWIPPAFPGEGNITIFNNGTGRPGPDFSEILEIVPPLLIGGDYQIDPFGSYGPGAPIWAYSDPDPTNFLANFISGARRIANGNTIICDGPSGFLFEVTPDLEIVWRYEIPVSAGVPRPQGTVINGNGIFRTHRFALDHPHLAGRDLTPTAPIETYPSPADPDADGDVDLADFTCFEQHFSGPGSGSGLPLYASAGGFYFDFDLDGDVDCDDQETLETLWTEPPSTFPGVPSCVVGVSFLRGDASDDGQVNIADAVACLGHLFSGGSLNCLNAADVNDDEAVDISDPIALLQVLFGGGSTIPDPSVSCGIDPTAGGLSCDASICP